MFETIRADIERKIRSYGVRPQDMTFFRKSITPFLEFGTLAVVVHRFGRWAYTIKIPVLRQALIGIYLVVNTICLAITGIHVQRESEIGPGLVIHNSMGIFVLAKRIGHSCTVNQGVSVASVRGAGWPTIGNNVYLGAGCKVIGGVTVGDNVVVSANSLVVSDVPSNCTVMGVPARIISREVASPYLKTPVAPTTKEAPTAT
jgi:serine O-acetyltransferase